MQVKGVMMCSLTWAGRVPFEDKTDFVMEEFIFKGKTGDKETEMRWVKQGEGKYYEKQKENAV